MNIVLTVGDVISPIRGGGAARVLHTGRELSSRGHNIKFYAPSDKAEIGGIPVESIPVASQASSMFMSSARLMHALSTKLIRDRKSIDIVFAHNIAAAIPSLMFCKLFNKKFVYDMTDIQTEYFLQNKKSFAWQQMVKMMISLEYFIIRHSPKVIVVSNAMKDVLANRGINSEKVSVAYDGVDVKEFRPNKQDENAVTIIHHGGICPHDGVPLIPKAAKLVLERYPDTKFYILADGTDMANVKKAVEENDVAHAFTFTGWVPYESMKEYLNRADIGLITRTNTQPNNTIITLKLLDYWASGTAVVASRLKGISEVSKEGENILLFEPESAESLADKIRILIEDRELLKKIQTNGNRAVQEFDWKSMARRIADITMG